MFLFLNNDTNPVLLYEFTFILTISLIDSIGYVTFQYSPLLELFLRE